MPVIEHEVHASVVLSEGAKYGCWNRPDRFAKSYWAPNRRFYPDGSFEVISVRIPHNLSHDCRYDGKNGTAGEDPRCEGCRHYKASDYVRSVAERGR